MTIDQVVYVTSRWGEPSQTFVRREARAMVGRGVVVRAMSMKHPVPGDPTPVVHLGPVALVIGVLRVLAAHPARLARVLGAVVWRSSIRNAGHQTAAALIGVAWVGSGRIPSGHLHAHFGWVAATAAWAATQIDGRSFSVSLHAFEIHDRRYVDGFTNVPLRAATAVFTESHRDQQIVAERTGVEPTVTRLGVPLEWLGTPGGDREPDLVVSVGRLVEKKGYPFLLEALARCVTPWHCRIVGDGPLRDELERNVRDLGLSDRVELLGAQDESAVLAELARAAVSCLASVETSSGDRDGTPMALIEAMASGAAVVATDTGSIAELIADAGIVVPAGDVDALAAALDRLADPELRLELGRRAVARVESGWTADRTAATVLERLASVR